jgi:preprotein translocase subunit SecG
MFGFLVGVEILVSILLMIIVLMQASKGGGLAGTFGGGTVGTMFGVRRTADFLSRATWMLGGLFILLSLVINLAFLPSKGTKGESVIQRSTTQGVPPPALPQSAPAAIPDQAK